MAGYSFAEKGTRDTYPAEPPPPLSSLPNPLLLCRLHFVYLFVRFTSVRIGAGGTQGIGIGEAGHDTGGGFMEEYLLEDLELSPADLGE